MAILARNFCIANIMHICMREKWKKKKKTEIISHRLAHTHSDCVSNRWHTHTSMLFVWLERNISIRTINNKQKIPNKQLDLFGDRNRTNFSTYTNTRIFFYWTDFTFRNFMKNRFVTGIFNYFVSIFTFFTSEKWRVRGYLHTHVKNMFSFKKEIITKRKSVTSK